MHVFRSLKSNVSEGQNYQNNKGQKKREIIESDLATLQDKCRDIKLVESLLQYKTRPEYNFIFSGGYEVGREKYYWSGLYSDVRTNISGCHDQEDEGV